ncbi:hypothetical protein [Ollibium composti]|uniref:Na+-dependent transporter n=1 Tax=Ollibium composti TaxID=2675109 RepID=A0ABY2Q1T6_9HYPH|nr:hypothetical protein [Mesorhizobium composti]THF54812.1 hypothetical protein E6C48_20275 [Mesorhizobium composti]
MIVVRLLAGAARHGRLILVIGLVVGILLPGLALAMKDWIAELIAGLLFIAALRVGPRQAVGALAEARASLGLALVYQIAVPAAALSAFALCGWKGALATGLILMMAASPISGAPNLAILTGNDPAPALRQLVIGTALLPLTVLPVFWLAPALGETAEVLRAAGRLLVIIGAAAGAAFLVRAFLLKAPSRTALDVIDGLSAIAMAIVVVGLMSAVGPALRGDPALLAAALAAAFIGNFGLQIAAAVLLRRLAPDRAVAPLAITAGNRNVALFLTALPTSVTDPLLLFIGCYQIPMYLTPLLLGRFYRSRDSER